MPLKHAFTSSVSDGGDATLVRPSNWNANHTITSSLALGDIPPASPGTYDEEWEGTADTLPSGWAWTSAPSGSDTWNLNSRWPSLLTVEGSANTNWTLTRTSFSAAQTFGLWCKVHVGLFTAADGTNIRMYASNSGSTERRGLNYRGTGNHASGVRALRIISSVESVWSTEITGMVAGGATMYMGMTRDGSSNWLAWWSRDGISWDALGASQSHTITVDRIVCTFQTVATPGLLGFDWIRYRTDNAFPRP
jgi:transposase